MEVKNLSEKISQAYKQACLAELEALKPGNVHIFADGHGMTIEHFIQSAEVTASIIAKPNLTVGERIYQTVEATKLAVGLNTNLGIILLCAPIIDAAFHFDCDKHNNLQFTLKNFTLKHLSQDDAKRVADAILMANPAGLGEVEAHDVQLTPNVTLLTMMQAAAERDRIAWQYANDFSDIFEFGLSQYQKAMAKYQNQAWATTALYLAFLATLEDTHVNRKHGQTLAAQVLRKAKVMEKVYWMTDNPKLVQQKLLDWDKELKKQNLNPGTSADFTVATLFLSKIYNILIFNDKSMKISM